MGVGPKWPMLNNWFLSESQRRPTALRKYPNQNELISERTGSESHLSTPASPWTPRFGCGLSGFNRTDDELLFAFAKTIGRGSRVSNFYGQEKHLFCVKTPDWLNCSTDHSAIGPYPAGTIATGLTDRRPDAQLKQPNKECPPALKRLVTPAAYEAEQD